MYKVISNDDYGAAKGVSLQTHFYMDDDTQDKYKINKYIFEEGAIKQLFNP